MSRKRRLNMAPWIRIVIGSAAVEEVVRNRLLEEGAILP
jgi:hypothetical protein